MHKEIIQLLNEKRLKEAFTQIKEAAATLNNWELKTRSAKRFTISCFARDMNWQTRRISWKNGIRRMAILPTHSASSPKPLHTHSRNSISCWKQLNAHSTCRKSTKKKRREYTVIRCMSTPSMSCSTRYGSLHNGVKKTTRKHVNFYSHHPWLPTTKL